MRPCSNAGPKGSPVRRTMRAFRHERIRPGWILDPRRRARAVHVPRPPARARAAPGVGGPASPVTAVAPPRPRSRLGSRRRLTIAVIVLLGAIGALLYQGLSNAATYFYTADQAVARKTELGGRR